MTVYGLRLTAYGADEEEIRVVEDLPGQPDLLWYRDSGETMTKPPWRLYLDTSVIGGCFDE